MRAVVYDAPGQYPELRMVADPVCPPHGVVVEVRATGVCRSDWHAWMGHDPVPLPQVPGHELAGVVAEVGSEVTRWSVGDRVTCPFVCACGDCSMCRIGEGQVCERQTQPGFTGWGSFAELVALDHADVNLVAIPADLTFDVAASLGCRFATAYRALSVHGQIWQQQPGHQVAIFGCGGLGQAAVMIAAAAGARVVAIDINPAALALASRLGADAVINARQVDDVAAAVGELTGGVELTLDALGSRATASAALRSLRGRGRHVQAGLLLGPDAEPGLPMGEVIARELEIYGSHGMAAHEYPELMGRIASGQLRPELLIDRTITLEEAPAALAGLGAPSSSGIAVVLLG